MLSYKLYHETEGFLRIGNSIWDSCVLKYLKKKTCMKNDSIESFKLKLLIILAASIELIF